MLLMNLLNTSSENKFILLYKKKYLGYMTESSKIILSETKLYLIERFDEKE
jgi:hypothetical protein